MRKTLITGTAVLALALGLSACGDDNDDRGTTSSATSEPGTTDSTPSTLDDDNDDDMDDTNDALTGDTLKKASDAALKATGGGRVTDAERSDDPDHAYEVEVQVDGNDDVTVELDDKFGLVRIDR
jgi:uncharacterized membrane protein YkoI